MEDLTIAEFLHCKGLWFCCFIYILITCQLHVLTCTPQHSHTYVCCGADALLAAETQPMEPDEDNIEDEEMQQEVQPEYEARTEHEASPQEQPPPAARPPAKPSGLAKRRRR